MWRIILPLFEFAVDCSLALAAFAVLSVLVCGIWESAKWPRYRRHDSFTA
jgi:hypothetical protein